LSPGKNNAREKGRKKEKRKQRGVSRGRATTHELPPPIAGDPFYPGASSIRLRRTSRHDKSASHRVASRRVEFRPFARSLARRGEYRVDDRRARPQHGRVRRVSRSVSWALVFHPFLSLSFSHPGPKLFIAAGLMSTFCAREHEKFRGPYAARRIRQHF